MQMNIIYANGFRFVKGSASGGGGKGLFSGGKGAQQGDKYYVTYIGALGEGEFNTILAMWENQSVYTPATLPAGKTIIFFSGGETQTAWSYITTNWPSDAFDYKNTCYLGFQDYEIDPSGTIPQQNFLVAALFAGTCPLYQFDAPDGSHTLFDADPALCVFEFLTNFRFGVQFPTAYIDQDTLFTSASGFDPDIGDATLSTYCQAVGFGWSTTVNNSEAASSILDRWMKNLVVAPIWNGSILKFIPYCDTPSGANPGYSDSLASVARKYYTPNTSPLFNLTVANFIQSEGDDDPIVITRVDAASDLKNTIRINFRDRYNYFNDNVAEAKDELSSELYGPRVERIGTADEFTLKEYAATSAQLQLQRNIAIRTNVEFRLAPQWCILDPMDPLTITYPALGLVDYPIRIKEIEEDEEGILTIKAEEFPAGSMQSTLYDVQSNNPTDVFQNNIPAPSVNDPAIFEPTADYLNAASQPEPIVVLGVSGGPGGTYDPNWGGCQVWLSNDNITYSQYATIVGPARMGELTAPLPAYAGAAPDVTNSLFISLAESNGALESVTDFQAIAGLSLCVIIEPDGTYEFVGYVTATLTGANAYTLTRLYRGMFGTQGCAHGAGAKFVRYDGLCKEIVLPPVFIGTTIYIKLPSFNIFGLGLEDISTVTVYSYTPAGFGSGSLTNPLALDLQNSVTPIDLGSYYTPTTLDLGGIAGECAPIGFLVDLESY